jgi:hypothetical protein
MTIKEIIKLILSILSGLLSISLEIISLYLWTQTWLLIAIIVDCIVAIAWLIEGLSNYHIYSEEQYGEKTYHIGHNNSHLRALGFLAFGVMLYMMTFPLVVLVVF